MNCAIFFSRQADAVRVLQTEHPDEEEMDNSDEENVEDAEGDDVEDPEGNEESDPDAVDEDLVAIDGEDDGLVANLEDDEEDPAAALEDMVWISRVQRALSLPSCKGHGKKSNDSLQMFRMEQMMIYPKIVKMRMMGPWIWTMGTMMVMKKEVDVVGGKNAKPPKRKKTRRRKNAKHPRQLHSRKFL